MSTRDRQGFEEQGFEECCEAEVPREKHELSLRVAPELAPSGLMRCGEGRYRGVFWGPRRIAYW